MSEVKIELVVTVHGAGAPEVSISAPGARSGRLPAVTAQTVHGFGEVPSLDIGPLTVHPSAPKIVTLDQPATVSSLEVSQDATGQLFLKLKKS